MDEHPSSGSDWRRVRLSALTALIAFATVAAVNVVVNPYRAWPIDVVDRAYLRIDGAERIAVPFQLTIARPRIVLVGSSRVLFGMQIEQGERDGVLNAGLPAAALDEIGALVDAARRPSLHQLVWGIDYFAFTAESAGMRDPKVPSRLRRDGWQLARDTLLSLNVLRASGATVSRALRGKTALPLSRRASLPWPPELIATVSAEDRNAGLPKLNSALRALSNEWIPAYDRSHISTERWDLFRSILSRTKQDGIEVSLFVAPMSAYELELIVQSGNWESFLEWKRMLAAAQPYWDFSGYGPATTAEHLYLDPVHIKPWVGHTILRHLVAGNCRDCGAAAEAVSAAGVRVDPQTVEAHLHDAAVALARYRAPDGPAAHAIAESLTESRVHTVTTGRANGARPAN